MQRRSSGPDRRCGQHRPGPSCLPSWGVLWSVAKSASINERRTMTDTETRTDAETRGLILKRLYELHTKSEWVDWDNFHELNLPQQEVGRYLKELHDLGLAEGKFTASDENHEYADVRARIRARGADAVENPAKRPSEIVIDQSFH